MEPPRGTTTSRWASSPGTPVSWTVTRAGAQGPEGGSGGRQLVLERRPLPGDEDAARSHQRQRDLDQLGEVGDGARGHDSPPLAVTGILRDHLRSDGLRGHPIGQAGGLHDRAQEPDLLGDRVDEQGPLRLERRRERQARVAAAGAEVEETRRVPGGEEGDGRKAVQDMEERDAFWVAGWPSG